MRWITINFDGMPMAGVVEGDTVRVLGPEPLQFWFNRKNEALKASETSDRIVRLADARIHQPILRPGKMLAIALNYRKHVDETHQTAPPVQKWFIKQATAANGPYDSVELPSVSDQLDYEAELVVVIGKHGRHVPQERALEIVAGVCCGCDYSVRDWQRASPTMIMGKGFDTHAPFGPWITSLDEIEDLNALGIHCWVNDDKRQGGTVSEMIFGIEEQIAHLSKAFTLEPGDVIFTGTPAGVGAAYTPPKFLKAGDRVRIEIDGLGEIAQTITPESGKPRIG